MNPSDPRLQYQGVVIAIVGPPHSGKSVFLAELYRQLLQRQPKGVFLHRACPDGEGMWSNEAKPSIVQSIRKKSAFSEEFVAITLKGIEQLGRNPTHQMVLLDLGGKRTAENAEILKRSTHCIILSSQVEEIELWKRFVTAEGCEVIAVFKSELLYLSELSNQPVLNLSARSTLVTGTLPMQGTFVNLCRDCSAECYQESMSSVVEILLNRFSKKSL